MIAGQDLNGMKFDVAVGNPPYSRGGENRHGGDATLYQEFSLAALKSANIVAFITPGTFKRQSKFKELHKEMNTRGVAVIQQLPHDVFGKHVRVDDPTYWIVGCGSHTVADLTEDDHDRLQASLSRLSADQRKWRSGQAPVFNDTHKAVLSQTLTDTQASIC